MTETRSTPISQADLHVDLTYRWVPSEAQIAGAEALLAAGLADPDDGVYTLHLLVHKSFGFWTTDVEVVHLDGLFTTREAALGFLEQASAEHHRKTGHTLTGGYTVHFAPGDWAVFEDIMSRYPERQR